MRPFTSVPVLVLVAAAGLFSAEGCRRGMDAGDPGILLDLAISPTPPSVGPARIVITLTDTAGGPLEGARVVVEGTMTHPGMAPVLDSASAAGSGRYHVPAFSFTMAGDWVLEIEARLPDGRTARFQRSTGVARAPGGLEE